MKLVLHFFFLVLLFNFTFGQTDWKQGSFYELKGSSEVFCNAKVEKVLIESASAYRDEFFYMKQRGYQTCTERVWSKMEHQGIVYYWDEFREEWASREDEGEFWVYYWRFSKKRMY